MFNISGEVLIDLGLIVLIGILIFNNNRYLEKKFTKKELCKVLHGKLDEQFADIKKDVKEIPSIKAKLDLLLRKNGVNHGSN